MKKRKYKHQDVITTATNLLTVLEQEALLHPYPGIRSKAAEATEVLRELILVLSREKMEKNAVLNRIACHPVSTAGGAALLPMLRTPITAGRLDPEPLHVNVDQAKELLAMELEIEEQKPDTPARKVEMAKLSWCLQAIEHLEKKEHATAKRIGRIHIGGLMEMAKVGVNYAEFPD